MQLSGSFVTMANISLLSGERAIHEFQHVEAMQWESMPITPAGC